MKRIERTGTVVSVESGSATVELEHKHECSPSLSCGCCSEPHVQRVKVAAADLQTGDTVSISYPAYLDYISTLAVFVMPLVLFVAGAAVGWSVSGGEGGGETGLIVGGVVGFVSALGLASLANRWASRDRNMDVKRTARAGS